MLLGSPPRTWGNKIREAHLALRLEKQFSKKKFFRSGHHPLISAEILWELKQHQKFILEKTRIPSSHRISCTCSSSQKPSEIDSPQTLLAERNKRIDTLMQQHLLSETKHFCKNSPIPTRKENTKYAEHFVQAFFQNKKDTHLNARYRTSRRYSKLCTATFGISKRLSSAFCCSYRRREKQGAIRAYLGNADFENDTPSREVDMLRAFRSTGSALKPFLYLLSFEELGWNAKTVLLDDPIAFPTESGAPYIPKNFDLTYRGEISVRNALAESRNIPAVETLNSIGEASLSNLFEKLGIESLVSEENAGLSAALGSREIRPLDLLRLYLALAREGNSIPLCAEEPCAFPKEKRVFSQEASREITAILADNTARIRTLEKNPLFFSLSCCGKNRNITGFSR